MTPDQLARQVQQQGFCLFPGIYSTAQTQTMRTLLGKQWQAMGSPEMSGWGVGINQLMTVLPDLAPYFAHPTVVETLAHVLGDAPRIVHAGARLSNRSSAEAIGWHHHYHNWDASLIPSRTRCERVLYGVYVDGSNEDAGHLIVIPRKYNDPLHEPLGPGTADWPGQILVSLPPGSGIIFDTALWHTAKRGRADATRHLFGTHIQAWSDTRPHREDNLVDTPELDAACASNPLLRAIIRR
jgi:hypothetical protein